MRRKFCVFILFISFPVFATRWAERAFETVETGSLKDIRRAVETDYSFVKYKDEEKRTVLLSALEKSRENEIIKFLLDSGASPKARDKYGKTALMYACQNEDDMDTIRTLIKHSALFKFQKRKKILQKDKNGKNCFDYAMENSKKEELIAILSEYAENPYDVESENEAQILLQEEPQPKIAPVVTEIPQDVKTPDSELKVSEPQAIENSLEDEHTHENELIEFDKMAAPAAVMDSIYLYDYAADSRVDTKIPQDLIASAATYTFVENAGKADRHGKTFLMAAAKKGDVKQMRDLVYSGADVNARDDDGWTALMYAVRYQENTEAVKFLLNNGASPLVKNNYGANSMMIAAGYSKNPEIVEMLIKPYKSVSDDVRTAFVYGIQNSNSAENLKPFIDKKLKLNIPFDGKTYLMYACESNDNTDIIAMLLDSGASKTQSAHGKTAFDYAKQNHRLKHDSVYWSLNVN